MKTITKYVPECCKTQEFDTREGAIEHERTCSKNKVCQSCSYVCRRFDRVTGEEKAHGGHWLYGCRVGFEGCSLWKYREH